MLRYWQRHKMGEETGAEGKAEKQRVAWDREGRGHSPSLDGSS